MLERSEVAHCHTVLSQLSNPLIIHHWDVDGIASAALLQRLYGWRLRHIPPIDEYGTNALREAPSHTEVVFLDYGGVDAIKYYLETHMPAKAVIVDHHRYQCPRNPRLTCCNPVAWGGLEDHYPSTTILLYQALGAGLDLAILGWLGDQPAAVERVGSATGLPSNILNRYSEAARTIDSCYIILSRECVEHAVELLASRGVDAVSTDPVLTNARLKADKVVSEASRETRLIGSWGPIKAYILELDALVTSAIGRKLAAEDPSSIIVLAHWIPGLGKCKLYVRSVRYKVGRIASSLAKALKTKHLSVSVGGKDYVLVAHVYGSNCSRPLQLALKTLKQLLTWKSGSHA